MCFWLFLICDCISWQWLPPLQPLIPLFETAIEFILKLNWSILHLLNYDLACKLWFHRHPISGQEMVWMWYFYSRGNWLLEIKKKLKLMHSSLRKHEILVGVQSSVLKATAFNLPMISSWLCFSFLLSFHTQDQETCNAYWID